MVAVAVAIRVARAAAAGVLGARGVMGEVVANLCRVDVGAVPTGHSIHNRAGSDVPGPLGGRTNVVAVANVVVSVPRSSKCSGAHCVVVLYEVGCQNRCHSSCQ